MEPEYIKTIAENEARSKSNTHRLDGVDKELRELRKQSEQLAVMCSSLQQQGETIKKIDRRLETLENKPANLWEKVVSTALTVLVTAAVTYLLTR